MTRHLKFELIRACACVLALSILVRSLPFWSLPLLRMFQSDSSTPAPAEQGQVSPEASAPAEETPLPETRILPMLRFRDLPQQDNPADITLPEPLPVFTTDHAKNITVRGNCTLPYDRNALLLSPLPEILSSDEPLILIVQTHSTEAFQPEPGWEYEETEACRTLDPQYSVIRLGAEIASILEENGIPVLHDQTINDYPSYSGSYDRMEAIIQSYLDKYPSIRMVLDVHRDAFENPDGSMGGTAKDGRAKVMLVTGTNEGGLYHPDWQDNLAFSLKLEALMQQSTPGLSRGISLTTQRYNQHLTPMSLLAEFGSAGDTLQEAIAAAQDFAMQLSRLLSHMRK